MRVQPGTPASQGDELRQGHLCPCTSPDARWPKAELEPSALELCVPCYGVIVLERSAHIGVGAGEARGRGRRPCGWAGTAPSLLSESDSDPLLAPACSGSASCSFGSWRLGWLFTSPPALRPRRRVLVSVLPPPPLIPAKGWERRRKWSGCWVLGALPVIPPG